MAAAQNDSGWLALSSHTLCHAKIDRETETTRFGPLDLEEAEPGFARPQPIGWWSAPACPAKASERRRVPRRSNIG